MSNPSIAIEMRNVYKRFPNPSGGEVIAVNNVSLEIKDGEFFSLLGPSGCGKTTSLRMIAGFELPTEGEIFVHGKAIGQTPPYKRPVNTVFQNYALFPHMTIGQNVAFGLEMDKVPKTEIGERVKKALEMVRLPGYEKRQPRQLSGGQQQRVALARALVKHPEVLLLDEPLGALDLKLRKEMQLELKKLQREVGITFIYVTHDQEEALTMSDRIAVMSGGKVLQVGNANEIYERPNCRFVADFIGETSFLQGKIKSQKSRAVEVELKGGQIAHAESDLTFTPGQEVTMAIRPEKMSLLKDANDGYANHLAGKVDEVVYIGTDTHYRVQLPGEQTLRVREQNTNPNSLRLAEVGESVRVGFHAAAARLLTE
ncbi:MAG: ABC transporter ATP-binding protein [Anaerolineales bacterium]